MTRGTIAIATAYYRPVLGGAESAAERLAAFLVRQGRQVVVLTKRTRDDHPREETIDGVVVRRLGPTGERAPSGKWLLLPALTRALMVGRQEYCVVCCVDYRAIGLAALATRLLTATPAVFQAQTEGVLSGGAVRRAVARWGASADGRVAQLTTWPIRALYRQADAIGCISHDLEREALEAGVPPARVHYLPNPIDLDAFAPVSADERRAIRRRLDVPDGAVLVTFVGRLSREKGVLELVHAWSAAKPAAILALIGPPMPGHAWDVSVEARRVVDASGVAESVRFVGGQPPGEVAAWLRAADLAVQPSHFEAMGLAAAEAMAAGLPVIASDATGYRDFVRHRETGWIVPARAVDPLREALLRLVGDSALRQDLGARALVAASEFDERVVLGRFQDLIDRLTATREGRRP